MRNEAWSRFLQLIDVEMFQKGWRMLLLIIGSIGILFAICTILVAGH